ncbi:MAG TPA: TolC family outer membrane protein [Gammaproteobacteria bacterium]|nr:TolC family outer membrane protein [Gammaproteobacteria bacterium]
MNTIRTFLLGLATAGFLVAGQAHATDLWDVYQLALKNDPTFQQAQANYEAQVENKAIARAGYLPNLTLNASRQRSENNGDQIGILPGGGFGLTNFQSTTYNTNYNVQLRQPIFDWAAWKSMDQADATVAQAEADFESAKQDLILRTATAYFNVLNARDTLAANDAAKQAYAKQLEQAKEKYQVGMSAITDVQEAQAAYDLAVANEINAQQQVTTAEEQLRAITGEPVGDLQEPVPDMPLRSPDPASAKQWVEQALKQNPNLLSAQAAAQAASANVGIKQANDYYPTLSLVAQRNKNHNTGNNIFDLSDTNGTVIGVQLSFPLFSGGGATAQVTQAQRQYDAAEDQAKLVTRQTEQQTRTAYLGVLTGISQVQAYKQSVQSNQTSLQATETGMQVGTRTIVDVLTARQNLLNAQTSFANSRYTYLKSVLQLKQAAGILGPEDVKQINSMMQVTAPNPGTDTQADTSMNDPAAMKAAGTGAGG